MCAMQGHRARLSQQIQELRNIIALQEQGRDFSKQLAEEKLSHSSSLLSQLSDTVQEDVHALRIAQKHGQRITSEVCIAHKNLLGKSVQEAREKLQRSIFHQVNTCNALLHEVRQRIRAQDALWQQLRDVRLAGKWHQEQVQRIRQLENSVDKMHMKIHTAQKVTTSYLVLQDALKKELRSLALHLELLHKLAGAYRGEAKQSELMAADAIRASDMAKKDLARLEARYLAEEEELRQRCVAARKAQSNWLWFREIERKHLRARARSALRAKEPSMLPEDSALGPKPQASMSQLEHKAFVRAEMEKAKAALQCSRIQGITGMLLAQHESTAVLEEHIRACKEKQQALMDTLRPLELEVAKLKFCEPPVIVSCRKQEAELRERLQQEEARLEQARASYMKQKELLLLLENGIDNLVTRLYSNAKPEQDPCIVDFRDMDEKLQYCRQKLQHLAQRVASLPAHCYSPDKDNKIFVKVRNLLEKMTSRESKLMTPSKDVDSGLQGRRAQQGRVPRPLPQPRAVSCVCVPVLGDLCDFPIDREPVLSREDIKKQGQRLMARKMRSNNRK
ncbi:coiled-coil domain-containing protein 183-like [Cyrtonyx montezumae]|uniref:coiled-coil domain-containing protein 183-like n=1 Tax=Cyrtonyx montezumae TaxID=9017 RepID=UPI0032DABD77